VAALVTQNRERFLLRLIDAPLSYLLFHETVKRPKAVPRDDVRMTRQAVQSPPRRPSDLDRLVDDIFAVGPELRVMTAVQTTIIREKKCLEPVEVPPSRL